ncbi:response regulator transcription factor [Nonomuraea sp. LPB2021202275-12-8]|uniref:response regulator transcription factor n=1 Tax=Nonomuraea sp. LPB2021202275-12-8 TaxID=3120159 RepID=UPI00300C7A26
MIGQQVATTMNGETRTKPVLLIADPDTAVVQDVAAALEREGVAVTGAADGAQGLLQAGALQPDVVLVSATLPVIDAASPESRKVLAVGEVELDLHAYQVRVDGRIVHLPLREFELLLYLMRNADRTVTREQIMRHVWQAASSTSTNTISVHVKRLRARLGDDDDQLIQTVRGVGYRLVTPGISGTNA